MCFVIKSAITVMVYTEINFFGAVNFTVSKSIHNKPAESVFKYS